MSINDYFDELDEKPNKDVSEALLLKYNGIIGGIIGSCKAYELTKMDSAKLYSLLQMSLDALKTDEEDYRKFCETARENKRKSGEGLAAFTAKELADELAWRL